MPPPDVDAVVFSCYDDVAITFDVVVNYIDVLSLGMMLLMMELIMLLLWLGMLLMLLIMFLLGLVILMLLWVFGAEFLWLVILIL